MKHPELVLMLVATGLYLYDSLQMLERNEAVMYQSITGKWAVAFGSDRWKIRSKEPFLPNPLTPHIALFTLRWSLDEQPAEATNQRPLKHPAELAGLAPWILVAAYSLFVLLPMGLFTSLGVSFSLLALTSLYASMVVALCVTYRRRGAFGLSNARFAALAFECIVCIPMGINLIRKLTRASNQNVDLNFASRQLLPAKNLPAYIASCVTRIQEEIEYEAENTSRMNCLQTNFKKMRSELSNE